MCMDSKTCAYHKMMAGGDIVELRHTVDKLLDGEVTRFLEKEEKIGTIALSSVTSQVGTCESHKMHLFSLT